MGQQGEPSVEEILDSIKKVIARDSEARSEMIAERRSRRAAPAETSEPVDEQEAEPRIVPCMTAVEIAEVELWTRHGANHLAELPCV